MPPGRLHLVILAAAVAAFFLVGAAQAAAGTMQVTLAGTGTGMVESDIGSENTGTPAIECSNILTEEIAVCENTMPEEFETLRAKAGPGSVLAGGSGWSITEGSDLFETEFEVPSGCNNKEFQDTEIIPTFGAPVCWVGPAESGNAKVTVTFNRAFTVKKVGQGTVVGTNSGIVCTPAKTECSAEYTGEETLTASPAAGYAFSSWKGCTTKPTALTCTVESATPTTVVTATFVETPTLTVTKAGSGSGKVLTTGISCDASCSKASAAVKTGAAITISTTPSKGSEAAVFESGTGSASGCSGASCSFTISANSSVKVKFDPKPTKTLTVNLTGPGAYKGKVKGKSLLVKGLVLAGVSCGSGCTSTTETFFASDEIELSASPASGYSLGGWTVTGGSAGTCTGTTTPCKLLTNANKTVSAEFK